MTNAVTQFTLTRDFACTPDQLWHLLTDAKKREFWGAPSDDHTLQVDRSNLSEGGTDLHRCGPVEAPDYTVETRWYRLAAPELACFTETVEAGGDKIATTLCTYGLAPSPSGCTLTLDVAVSSFVGPEALADFHDGWTSALSRLQIMAQG